MNEEVTDNYVHSLDIVNCKCTLMPQLENSIIDQRGSINCGEISRVLVLVFVKLSASAAPRHKE